MLEVLTTAKASSTTLKDILMDICTQLAAKQDQDLDDKIKEHLVKTDL